MNDVCEEEERLLALFPDWQILVLCLSLVLQLEMRKTNQHISHLQLLFKLGCACVY